MKKGVNQYGMDVACSFDMQPKSDTYRRNPTAARIADEKGYMI